MRPGAALSARAAPAAERKTVRDQKRPAAKAGVRKTVTATAVRIAVAVLAFTSVL